MTRECPACRHPSASSFIEKPPYRYQVCDRCGAAALLRGWADASYDRGYFGGGQASGYYDYQADRVLHLDTANRRLEAITRLLPHPARVIDVGAAYGYTLQAARARGWEAIGVEISEHASSALREAGFDVISDLASVDPASFDGVVFGQVLEHMPDPEKAIDQAIAALKPGGIVFIETWDLESKTAQRFGARWQQISPPSVVHLFTTRGLTSLIERQGLEVVSIAPWSKRVSVRGYLGVIASKLAPSVGRAMMRLANATGVAGLSITYRFDDLISVVARKPKG